MGITRCSWRKKFIILIVLGMFVDVGENAEGGENSSLWWGYRNEG
jgi:hypothetical protein